MELCNMINLCLTSFYTVKFGRFIFIIEGNADGFNEACFKYKKKIKKIKYVVFLKLNLFKINDHPFI